MRGAALQKVRLANDLDSCIGADNFYHSNVAVWLERRVEADQTGSLAYIA